MKQNDAPQTSVKAGRVFYFDVLRAMACAAVVMIHVAAQYWYSTDVHSAAWQVYNVCDSFIRWGVPMFVMLSGALFLDPDRDCSVKKLWLHSIPRMLAAFVFWSALYALPPFLYTKDPREFLELFSVGHHHMWFLWMIIGLYVIVPVLRQLVRDRRAMEYYLLVSVAAALLLPTLNQTIRLLGIPIRKESLVYQAVQRACGSSKMYFLLGYPAYFVLGYWLHTAKIRPWQEWGIYGLGLLSAAATAWVTSSASRITGQPELAFYEELSVQALLQSVAVFTLAKCRLSRWKPGRWAEKTVKGISGASFGIYLSHVYFLDHMHRKGYTYFFLSKGPVVYLVCVFAILFVLSWCVAAVLKKIPILNRYVV